MAENFSFSLTVGAADDDIDNNLEGGSESGSSLSRASQLTEPIKVLESVKGAKVKRRQRIRVDIGVHRILCHYWIWTSL